MASDECIAMFLVNRIHHRNSVPRRIFRSRLDAFALSDKQFIKLFRLDKQLCCDLITNIRRLLPFTGLPPELRVLVALRFYATGSYQQAVANDIFLAVSQSSVSRSVKMVSHAIEIVLLQQKIKFPTTDVEQARIKEGFYLNSGFPGIIGAIDCTHISIIAPTVDSSAGHSLSYVNRKGFHSINVQLVSDHNLKILGINAKFPGCVHDAFIWRQSAVRRFLTLHGGSKYWLIGDKGYPLEPWLLTPYMNPSSHVEENYNKKHASARNCVERCNGVLKSRFRCLHRHRVLTYSPTQASHIINACAVLHNLCIEKGIPCEIDDFCNEDGDDDEEDDIATTSATLTAARALRNRIASAMI